MTSRREFLGAAALSATRVLGANDRINVGIIGVGGMGFGHVRMLKPRTDIRITAISDIYTKRKQRAKDFLGLTDRDIHHETCWRVRMWMQSSSSRPTTGTTAWPWTLSTPA